MRHHSTLHGCTSRFDHSFADCANVCGEPLRDLLGAFWERKCLLIRSGYMILPSTGTPLDKSRKSMMRSCLPTQPHIFSTGLRPGERAGKSMNDMLGRCSALNDLLVRRIFAPASQTAYFTLPREKTLCRYCDSGNFVRSLS